jgi:hypothetical protein
MNIKDALLFVAIADVLQSEFDIDLEELADNELGLSEDCKAAIAQSFEDSELFARQDEDNYLKDELVKILKEIVDKFRVK